MTGTTPGHCLFVDARGSSIDAAPWWPTASIPMHSAHLLHFGHDMLRLHPWLQAWGTSCTCIASNPDLLDCIAVSTLLPPQSTCRSSSWSAAARSTWSATSGWVSAPGMPTMDLELKHARRVVLGMDRVHPSPCCGLCRDAHVGAAYGRIMHGSSQPLLPSHTQALYWRPAAAWPAAAWPCAACPRWTAWG